MKKSEFIKLVLVSITLASCTNQKSDNERKVYMRTDSTGTYTSATGGMAHGNYFAFRPYGIYNNNGYKSAGYYSSAINQNSNIGTNPFKNNVVRGGFGRSAFHVSS